MENRIQEIRKKSMELDGEINTLKREMEELQERHRLEISELSEDLVTAKIEKDKVQTFLNEPYVLLPTGKPEEWYVAVPKFIRMNLGYLDFSTQSYNVFKINKFISWLGEIPKEISSKFKFKEHMPLKVFDGMMLTGAYQDEAWDRYNKYLSKRQGNDKIKIKKGYEFKLIAKLIDDGILPFIPTPVDSEDMREVDRTKYPTWLTEKVNTNYFIEAGNKFIETGAVGVFWAFSAGKSLFGMHMANKIKGRKLVVVPTITLVEQWRERFRKYTNISHEVDIVTYHSFNKVAGKEYSLMITDETHHLPANQFSKFSTIRAKYRIGLSGSAYREDGRTEYIFALSGFPIGLSWDDLISLGVIEEPDIKLYIERDGHQKTNRLRQLLAIDKKTIIFCDSINYGKRLSQLFEIPFVYGQTKERLDIIQNSDTCVVSRVGDEGMSIRDIDRVIEIDFQFGSRRQEAQRMGRIFHYEKKGQHIIIMTVKEYESYAKRLNAIYEKGFRIEIVRGE